MGPDDSISNQLPNNAAGTKLVNQPDVLESISRGLAQALNGEGRSANEVLDELEREDVTE